MKYVIKVDLNVSKLMNAIVKQLILKVAKLI